MISRISLSKKEILSDLQIGSMYAGLNKALPICDCLKIRALNGFLYVSSTNGESAINVKIETTTIEKDMKLDFCANSKTFISNISSAPSDSIKLSVEDSKLTIKSNKWKSSQPLYPTDEFPIMMDKGDDFSDSFNISFPLLHDIVASSKTSCSNDDLRPVMNGIYFENNIDTLSSCASDGHVLMTNTIDIKDGDRSKKVFHFIMNKSIIESIVRLNKKDAETISFACTDNKILLRYGNKTIISLLVEGKYPNFRSVIPTKNPIKTSISVNDISNSISRSLLSSGATGLTTLSFLDNRIKISSSDIDYSVSAEDEIGCDGEPFELVIGVKGDYLLKCLKAFNKANTVDFEMTDPSRPILITSKDVYPNRLALIMPMVIN